MNIQSEITSKKELTISTALELFVTQGIQDTSMAQISKTSGVAVGTIYNHFTSKDHLIEEMYLALFEKFSEAVTLEDDETSLPFKERFILIMQKSYDFYIKNPNNYHFTYSHYNSSYISKEIKEKVDESMVEYSNLLNEGIKEKIFKEKNPKILMRWIYNNLISLVQLKLCEGVKLVKSKRDGYLLNAWKGIT